MSAFCPHQEKAIAYEVGSEIGFAPHGVFLFDCHPMGKEMNRAQTNESGMNLLANLLTEEQVSAELRISIQTLRRWAVQGRGPLRTKVGQRVYYRVSVLRDWLAAQQECPPRRRSRRLVGVAKQKS